MAAKALSIGGVGALPTLEDVVRVAAGLHVALDTAGAERIRKESPPPKSFEPEADQPASFTEGASLDTLQVRRKNLILMYTCFGDRAV